MLYVNRYIVCHYHQAAITVKKVTWLLDRGFGKPQREEGKMIKLLIVGLVILVLAQLESLTAPIEDKLGTK